MKTRIITGIVIGILLIGLAASVGTVILPCALTGLTLIGVGEFLHCTKLLKRTSVSFASFAFALAVDVCMFVCADVRDFCLCFTVMSTCFSLVLFAIATFSKGAISVDSVFTVFAGTFYVTFGFASLLFISKSGGGNGVFLLPMTIFLPLISDIFAYFTGFFFGKHKLIPEVSPKKTVEGSIGGMVACGIGCAVFVGVLRAVDGILGGADLVVLLAGMFAVGLVCSVVAQAGDLIMSVIKRRYGVKDYGKLFPGHGGVLDRFDSVLAVAIVMFALTFIPGFASFGA